MLTDVNHFGMKTCPRKGTIMVREMKGVPMSKHYWLAANVALDSLSEVQQRALAALAKTDPVFAAKLRRLDWNELNQEALCSAMSATGKGQWKWTANPSHGDLPSFSGSGTLLGSLSHGQLYLVASADQNGSITFHHGRYDYGSIRENPAEWSMISDLQKSVMNAYLVESSKTLATLLGDNLKVEKLPNGKTKVTVDLKGGKP